MSRVSYLSSFSTWQAMPVMHIVSGCGRLGIHDEFSLVLERLQNGQE